MLDGGPQVLRDVAMATKFWLSIGYNFGCMTASDTLFDSRGGFSGTGYPVKTEPRSSECLRVIAMTTNFGTKIAITGFV